MNEFTDDELSALIEACNVANRHQPRQPWGRAGESAWRKLLHEERSRGHRGRKRSSNASGREINEH